VSVGTNAYLARIAIATILLCALEQRSRAEDVIPPKASVAQTPNVRERTLTDMPYASIRGNRLIGNSGKNLAEHQWLVEDLVFHELLPMDQVYPRFGWPPGGQFHLGAWDRTLTYTIDLLVTFNGSFGRTFPRWRVCGDQLALFYARGGFSSPMRMYSGFHLIPYEHDARDYRRPGNYEIQAMKPEDAMRFANRNSRHKEGRLWLETAAYVFDKPPFRALGDDHRLIRTLHLTSCNGYDFVIDLDDTGVFFLSESAEFSPRHQDAVDQLTGPEDRPSKMIVLDYRMREEKGWVPQIDRSDVGAAKTEAPPAPPQKPQRPPVHREGEVVVGMSQPGVLVPAKRYTRPPDSVVSLKWTEKESFEVPFSVPFTAEVDGDDYFFVTNDGRIYRAAPAQVDGAERTVERVFDSADDPVIACVHESSTNRIFAFRQDSYILVDNAHFPADGTPHFSPCEDVTQPKTMTYIEEDGTVKTPDKRFQLVSRCANVLYEDGVLELSQE
jgi:hypothetical protein